MKALATLTCIVPDRRERGFLDGPHGVFKVKGGSVPGSHGFPRFDITDHPVVFV